MSHKASSPLDCHTQKAVAERSLTVCINYAMLIFQHSAGICITSALIDSTVREREEEPQGHNPTTDPQPFC